MKLGIAFVLALGSALLTGCGLQPPKPADTHLNAGPPGPEGTIPPAVQIAPLLPPPRPTARAETYSVVVNNVRLQELLFALARDARINVDIHPDVSGSVTLNAIDQTLAQLLARIARQVDMRYEMHGDTLVVMRDSPFLRTYRIDYLSATRNVKMQSTASTQFGTAQSGTPGGAGAGAATTTGATAQIDVTAENKLWESVVQNVKDILRETDRILPAGAAVAPATAPAAAAPGAVVVSPQAVVTPQQPTSTYQEAASVIGNRESGILYVRATSKQHEKVQEFLDQVLDGAKRQVLIEATVAEVQLRNEYQRGIDWRKLWSGSNGSLTLRQPAIAPPASFNPNPFLMGFVSAGGSFDLTVTLLEQFGDVRVLSSPKLSVLNNQTAILRVTRDIIYFTITPSTQPITIAGGAGATIQASFTTTPNVAAEGFMMTVLPYINENGAIVLNVKPTIRRRVADAEDPNPALLGGTPNTIPVFETREFDSILRLRSGEIAVLAGLMQDSIDNRDAGIPGLRSIPFLGELLAQKAELTTKTELVIFLRATVVRDPSLDGDFRDFRNQLPRNDFFSKPNSGK
jgi:general secretion pathway protein D